MKNITLYGLIDISKADQRSMQEEILERVLSFDGLRSEIQGFLSETEFRHDLAKYGQELTTKKACYRWVQYGNLACYRDVMQEDLKRLFGCTDHELEKLIEKNYLDDVDNMYFKLYADQVYHIVTKDKDLQITPRDILGKAQNRFYNKTIVINYIKDYLQQNKQWAFEDLKSAFNSLLRANQNTPAPALYATNAFCNAPYLDFEYIERIKRIAYFYDLSIDEVEQGFEDEEKTIFHPKANKDKLEDLVFERVNNCFVGFINMVLPYMCRQKEW